MAVDVRTPENHRKLSVALAEFEGDNAKQNEMLMHLSTAIRQTSDADEAVRIARARMSGQLVLAL